MILADWRKERLATVLFALVLMAGCVGLAVLFTRELGASPAGGQPAATGRALPAHYSGQPPRPSAIGTRSSATVSSTRPVANSLAAPEALQGKTAAEVLGADGYCHGPALCAAGAAGHSQVFERTITTASGEVRHVHITYTPDCEGNDGPVRGMFAQMTDITEPGVETEKLFSEGAHAPDAPVHW